MTRQEYHKLADEMLEAMLKYLSFGDCTENDFETNPDLKSAFDSAHEVEARFLKVVREGGVIDENNV